MSDIEAPEFRGAVAVLVKQGRRDIAVAVQSMVDFASLVTGGGAETDEEVLDLLTQQARMVRSKKFSEPLGNEFGENSSTHGLPPEVLAEWTLKHIILLLQEADHTGDPRYPLTVRELSHLFIEYGRYADAYDLLQSHQSAVRDAFGEDHPEYAGILAALGSVQMSLENYTLAEELLCEALAIREQSLNATAPDRLQTMNDLGVIYTKMARYDDAEEILERVVKVRRESVGERHPTFATSLHNLGLVYQHKDRFELARKTFLEVVEIRRDVLDSDHFQVANALNSLATACESTDQYREAADYMQEALSIRESRFGENHPQVLESLNNLGRLRHHQGQLSEARRLFFESMLRSRDSGRTDTRQYAVLLNNLAALLADMGDNDAERFLHEAESIDREILGDDHPDYFVDLCNRARLLSRTGRFEEAIGLLQQDARIAAESGREQNVHYAVNRNLMGGIADLTGEPELAIRFYEEGLQIFQQLVGDDSLDAATCLNNIAGAQTRLGEAGKAEKLYRKVLGIRSKKLGQRHPERAHTLNDLATLCVATGRADEALPLFREAAEIDDFVLGESFGISSDRQRLAFLDQVRRELNILLSFAMHCERTQPDNVDLTSVVTMAYDVVLRRKGIAAEAQMAQRQTLQCRDGEDDPRVVELQSLRRRIASLIGKGIDHQNEQQLQELLDRREQAEYDLSSQIPQLKWQTAIRAAGTAGVVSALPTDSALIEFVRFAEYDFEQACGGAWQWKPDRYAAFIVRSDDPGGIEWIDLGVAELMDQTIALLLACVSTEQSRGLRDIKPSRKEPRFVLPDNPAQDLSRKVAQKVMRTIEGCRRVFISPDGDFAKLPFEVIPYADSNHLIDTKIAISYVSCGRDIIGFRTPISGEPGPPLVVADPDFDLSADKPGDAAESRRPKKDYHSVDRLPGTQYEGNIVGRLLNAQVWMGADALKERLRSVVSPRILHIGTHGYVENEDDTAMFDFIDRNASDSGAGNPMISSGLVLSGYNAWVNGMPAVPEAADGMLTAEDAAMLDLTATRLVVLSICSSGLGRVRAGEGIFGLRRAFVLAGARTLVISLWKVDDLATAILMEQFYRNLESGNAIDQALRMAQVFVRELTIDRMRKIWLTDAAIQSLAAGDNDAQQGLIAMRDQKPDDRPFSDASYWAGFICQGDPSELQISADAGQKTDVSG